MMFQSIIGELAGLNVIVGHQASDSSPKVVADGKSELQSSAPLITLLSLVGNESLSSPMPVADHSSAVRGGSPLVIYRSRSTTSVSTTSSGELHSRGQKRLPLVKQKGSRILPQFNSNHDRRRSSSAADSSLDVTDGVELDSLDVTEGAAVPVLDSLDTDAANIEAVDRSVQTSSPRRVALDAACFVEEKSVPVGVADDADDGAEATTVPAAAVTEDEDEERELERLECDFGQIGIGSPLTPQPRTPSTTPSGEIMPLGGLPLETQTPSQSQHYLRSSALPGNRRRGDGRDADTFNSSRPYTRGNTRQRRERCHVDFEVQNRQDVDEYDIEDVMNTVMNSSIGCAMVTFLLVYPLLLMMIFFLVFMLVEHRRGRPRHQGGAATSHQKPSSSRGATSNSDDSTGTAGATAAVAAPDITHSYTSLPPSSSSEERNRNQQEQQLQEEEQQLQQQEEVEEEKQGEARQEEREGEEEDLKIHRKKRKMQQQQQQLVIDILGDLLAFIGFPIGREILQKLLR